MPSLSMPIDRKRLASILELISSDQPGERQAAAEAAHNFVRKSGLRWADILRTDGASPAPSRSSGFRSPYARRGRKVAAWRVMLSRCLERPEMLTAWEAGFVTTLGGQERLSPKQFAILARIAARVQA